MSAFLLVRRSLAAAAACLPLVACGSPDDLAAEAEGKAEAACACQDFDCTTEFIKWFNEVDITRRDDVAAMSAEASERYKTASRAASDCQQKLKPA